jgi:hypothetical protein
MSPDDVFRDTDEDKWYIFQEGFEAVGYDEVWSEGETKDHISCILEPDQPTAGIPDVPSWWENKCLRIYSNGSNVYIKHIFPSDLDVAYFRIELIIIDTHSMGVGEYGDILRIDNAAGQVIFTVHWVNIQGV